MRAVDTEKSQQDRRHEPGAVLSGRAVKQERVVVGINRLTYHRTVEIEATQHVLAVVLHGERGGLLGVFERRTSHGAAAVEHEAERGRARPGLGEGVGADANGEEHGPGLVGEDGLVVEVSFNLHARRLPHGF